VTLPSQQTRGRRRSAARALAIWDLEPEQSSDGSRIRLDPSVRTRSASIPPASGLSPAQPPRFCSPTTP